MYPSPQMEFHDDQASLLWVCSIGLPLLRHGLTVNAETGFEITLKLWIREHSKRHSQRQFVSLSGCCLSLDLAMPPQNSRSLLNDLVSIDQRSISSTGPNRRKLNELCG